MFDKNKEIVAMVFGGIVLILFLVIIFILSIIRYRKRVYIELQARLSLTKNFEKELLTAKLETQETTFQHIGKDLHDNIGQLLSTTKMLLGVTELNLTLVPDTLATANATLSKAIQELRFMSRSLDKEWLEQFNFTENLKNEIVRINDTGVIKATLITPEEIPCKADEQIILFRIVQEAIQNAIRHGMPKIITIEIMRDINDLKLSILNDGIRLPDNFDGMGTNNMKFRTKLLGGQIEWKSTEDTTSINIQLPIKSAANEN
jgi:signal transduction histidine kinase